jgi:hypothetical protein
MCKIFLESLLFSMADMVILSIHEGAPTASDSTGTKHSEASEIADSAIPEKARQSRGHNSDN